MLSMHMHCACELVTERAEWNQHASGCLLSRILTRSANALVKWNWYSTVTV